MSKLVEAFGKKFADNKDLIRIRSFELAGNTFKVKIPLTSEYEAMLDRIKVVDDVKVTEYYKELTKNFDPTKEEINKDLGIVFEENDIKIQGRSMMETAKNKFLTEYRILEMIKLLVPEEGYSLDDLTYAEIDELFPFSIQLELIEKIGEVISPAYKDTRGK
jgi:hypothetical protein